MTSTPSAETQADLPAAARRLAPASAAGTTAATDQSGWRSRLDRAMRAGAACGPRELALAIGVAVAVMVGWIIYLPLASYQTAGGDTTTYLQMAQNPKGAYWVPLAYRGLEPWLAHALGGASHYVEAFQLLTWASLVAAAVALYLICRRLGGTHAAGLVGLVGVMSLPMWLFLVYVPYLVDGPALALMSWSMLALINGWFAVLPLLLVVTGLARETVIGFAVPIYMWMRQRWVDLGAGWKTTAIIAPAFVVTWATRQAASYYMDSSTLGLMKYGLLQYVGHDVVPRPLFFLTYGIAGSLGLWWVLGLYGRRHGGRLWWLLVPVFAQWLFGSDYGRYALYAFPVVVAVGAIAVWQHPRRIVLLGLVTVQSLSTVADIQIRGFQHLYQIQPSTWISLALMVLAVPILWWPTRTTAGTDTALPRPRAA